MDEVKNKRSTPRTHVPNELALIGAAKTQAAAALHPILYAGAHHQCLGKRTSVCGV